MESSFPDEGDAHGKCRRFKINLKPKMLPDIDNQKERMIKKKYKSCREVEQKYMYSNMTCAH